MSSAPLLATFCLLNLAVVPLWGGELVVYLRTGALQPARPVDVMKRELAPLMLSAGYRVERRSESKSDSTASSLVVLELRGSCSIPAGGVTQNPVTETKDLASTAVSGETVLPFSSINCAALTRMLAPWLVPEAGARRDFLYGRAMARVLAHELYHILANTRDHEREGIAKAHFTFADLPTECFEFQHTPVTGTATRSEADGASGR